MSALRWDRSDKPSQGFGLWRRVLLCLLFLAGMPALAEETITLVLSDRGQAYRDVADAFRTAVADRRQVQVLLADSLDEEDLAALNRKDNLLVPVGLEGTRKLAALHTGSAPVLALMVPRSGFEEIAWPAGLSRRKLSAVFIDQPPARSLALVEAAMPRAKRIGVMVSTGNRGSLRPFRQEAERRRLLLSAEAVDSVTEVVPALRRLLPNADVFLLVPDALVINLNNVQQVLLTTYRYRVPVVGFSPGLVKAGAVVAVYSTPAQIGRQGGALASQWLAGEDLPAPQHCDEFSVDINRHVARSLELNLPDEAEIAQQLGAAR